MVDLSENVKQCPGWWLSGPAIVDLTPSSSSQDNRLLNLPSEILDEIMSYFQPQRNFEADWRRTAPLADLVDRLNHNAGARSTLRNLCLACKTLYRHAEPFLYSWAETDHQKDPGRGIRQLRMLVLKLAAKPELALRMKYIELRYDENTLEFGAIEDPGLRSNIEAIVAHMLGDSDVGRFQDLLGINYLHLFGLLLNQAPNLQHLALTGLERIPTSIYNGFAYPFYRLSHNLQFLQVLCLSFSTEYSCAALPGLLRSLQELPQLRFLKIYCAGAEFEQADEHVPFKFPKLRDFTLEGIATSPKTLANIINGCGEQLNSVACACYVDDENGYGDAPADMFPVDQALYEHRDTLKDLMVRLHPRMHNQCIAPITVLAHFPHLETLTIDTMSLLGPPWSRDHSAPECTWWDSNKPSFRLAERLPPGLVQLSLYNEHNLGDNTPVLLDLVEDCEHWLPQLKRVYSYTPKNADYSHSERGDWPELQRAFAEKGVTLL